MSFGANYSFVSKDLFEDVDGLGDIALNAPKNKFGASVQYLNADLGLGVGLRMRYVAGFPVRSGVYIGDLKYYYTFDLNAGYDLPIGPQTSSLIDSPESSESEAPTIYRIPRNRAFVNGAINTKPSKLEIS